jgi:hypothetical protein
MTLLFNFEVEAPLKVIVPPLMVEVVRVSASPVAVILPGVMLLTAAR